MPLVLRIESRGNEDTGEPDTPKGVSPVRGGADGKVPAMATRRPPGSDCRRGRSGDSSMHRMAQNRFQRFQVSRLVLAFCTLATLAPGQDVLTSRNDSARSGVQSHETILTPASVATPANGLPGFGLLRTLAVDGQVYAQPLYVSGANVYVNGKPQGKKNLLIVATEHDSVYCFDADNGKLYWQKSLLLPGETPSDSLGCSALEPEIGVTGTPVIDRTAGPHGTIYVVSFAKSAAGDYTYRLNALDLGTGNPTLGPTVIDATFPGNGPGAQGNGTVRFQPKTQRQRMGLALANGYIYIGFGSICDYQPFTGWMLVYGQQALTQLAAFNANPNGVPPDTGFANSSGAGIWQAGIAPIIDSSGGTIIFATGNGPFDPKSSDYGDSVLRLNSTPNNGVLNVADYFTPANQRSIQNADLDLVLQL
jgi:hypothetical protein